MIVANVVLTLWCLYLDPVINFDGVTYTNVAQLFMDGKWASVTDYYSWPFYSMFIAVTAKLLFIDVESAAFVLNTLFATSLTLAFVCIVAELSNNNRRIILIAAIVILLLPSISKYRSFIIRDFGYLSCYLWSLYFILRFCATSDKKLLAGWLCFAALSSLFRFEGIVFVLIAPYFLFLFSATAIPHRKKLLAGLSVTIAGVCIALLYWYINDKYMDSVQTLKMSGKNINTLGEFFAANVQNRLGDQALTPMSIVGLLLGTTGDVAYELIRRLAIFYFVFAIYAYIKELTLHAHLQRRIWQIYLATNLLVLVGFSLSNNFIVSRYTMASVLTLLILAPFAIDRFVKLTISPDLRLKIFSSFIIGLMILVSIEGLNVASHKQYIKDPGHWIANNLPAESRVYSNNKLVIYYADKGVEANLDMLYSLDILKLYLETGEVKTFDYIVLVGKTGNFIENNMRQTLGFRFGRPVKEFYGNKGSFAFIFSTLGWKYWESRTEQQAPGPVE